MKLVSGSSFLLLNVLVQIDVCGISILVNFYLFNHDTNYSHKVGISWLHKRDKIADKLINTFTTQSANILHFQAFSRP